MLIAAGDRAAAITDPAYHRYLCFGAADARRAQLLGRELQPHEAQGRLPWYQRRIIERTERAVAARAGECVTVRVARQGGKNESEAQLESRMLSIFAGVPGSVWVRTAPTYRPQIVNSKLRLEKFTTRDPLLRGRVRNREGFIVEHGHAQVHFLSGGESSNVVGGTASVALSVDEAHKIDQGKFEEDFSPFTASTNAPTILWGVAAAKLDLLYEYHERNRGTDRFLEFPADVLCEASASYAGHYAEMVSRLGEDHPVILTQYRLLDVESIGPYLKPAQRAALFSGDHPRLEAPRPGMHYGLVVDVGGESESDAQDAELMAEQPGRDYTMGWVLEWDPTERAEPYPTVRVVNGYWWVGKRHVSDDGNDSLSELTKLARHWGFRGGCVDARGVGEALAGALNRRFPSIEAYKALDTTVSEDCYDLQARLNTGRVKFWRADPAADAERREMEQQTRHTQYEIARHDLMRLVKPTGKGSTGKHIDGVKALTYLHRAVYAVRSGALDLARLRHAERLAEEAEAKAAGITVEELRRRKAREGAA